MKKIISRSILGLVSASAFAANPPAIGVMGDPVLMLSPEGQGIGGAGYAKMLSHDDLLENPAAGAFSKEYDANAIYSTGATTLEGSIFDTKSTSYGAGVSYIHRSVALADIRHPAIAGSIPMTYQQASLSFFGRIMDSLAIGLTGRYSNRSDTGSINQNDTAWNGDAGAAFRLNALSIGAVYKNILADKHNLETRTLAGGVNYDLDQAISFSGSVEKYYDTSTLADFGVPDVTKVAWSLGGQYTHSSGFILRAGYRDSEPWKSNFVFAGLGYKDGSFSVNYAFADVIKGDDKFSNHTFSLGLSF